MNWLIIVLVIVVLLLITAMGQKMFAELIALTGRGLFGYMVLFIRFTFRAHYLIFKNLIFSRKIIYPSLERDDQVNLKR